jgi:nicotinic acid mononucleotide adenylyltransferase
MSNHLVVARPGYELHTAHVTPAVLERIVDVRGLNPEEIARRIDEVGDEEGGARIYVTDAVFMDVSATAIRESISAGRDDEWPQLVTQPVADYIRKYRLYKKDL